MPEQKPADKLEEESGSFTDPGYEELPVYTDIKKLAKTNIPQLNEREYNAFLNSLFEQEAKELANRIREGYLLKSQAEAEKEDAINQATKSLYTQKQLDDIVAKAK